MKKLILLLFAIIVPLSLFSFLANIKIEDERQIDLFYESDLRNHSLILNDLTETLTDQGFDVQVGLFQSTELNSFLLSNPDALYITDRKLHSEIFVLNKIEYNLVKIAVTTPQQTLSNISSGTFDELLMKTVSSDADVIKKVSRNRIPIGVISFQNLNLNLKTLKVDETFPTLYNIRYGHYSKNYRANIYARKSNTLLEMEEFREKCGLWIDKSFSFVAGGDIMLNRGTKKYLKQFGPRYPFMEIHSEIIKHDIAFANLESPLSSRGRRFYPHKGIYFRAEPSVIEGLIFSGFDALSLGNNHALDWGVEALQDTMQYLDSGDLKYSGAGKTREEALKPAVFSVNGTSVAIIALNGIYPFHLEDDSGVSMRTLTYDKTALEQEISLLEKKYDVVIASFHSGIEYIPEPEAEKIDTMRNLVDLGVDIIVGSHPHVIQGIEVYNGGLIAYSLGNLIFDQSWSKETSLGLLLEIGFLHDKPLYYFPRVVHIDNAQAKLIQNGESKSILSSLNLESRSHEYVKN
jgi:poly-gamma-glutamate synthesis protein (capsule biosynthesis protein)